MAVGVCREVIGVIGVDGTGFGVVIGDFFCSIFELATFSKRSMSDIKSCRLWRRCSIGEGTFGNIVKVCKESLGGSFIACASL